MSNTLHIPEFAHGFLLSKSYTLFDQVIETGELDDWQQVDNVPLSSGKHWPRECADYDLNFFYDEDEDKWNCTAYQVWRDKKGVAHTAVDEWLRLW